jgi:hypothetical protein
LLSVGQLFWLVVELQALLEQPDGQSSDIHTPLDEQVCF